MSRGGARDFASHEKWFTGPLTRIFLMRFYIKLFSYHMLLCIFIIILLGGPCGPLLIMDPLFGTWVWAGKKNPRLVVRVRNTIPLHVGWIIISGDFNYWQTLDSLVLFTLKYKYILHIASRAAAASKAWHWLLLDTGSPLVRSTYNKTRSAAIMSRSYLTPTQTPAPFSPANT